MKKLVFLFSMIFMGRLWALGLDEVNLQELSSSGRSLVIDRGVLEDFDEGLYAKFFVQRGPKEFPKIFLVAEGELVKSFPRKSFWLMKRIYIPDSIQANSKILLLTSKQIKPGRPLKIKRRHVVMPGKDYSDVDDFIDKNKDNVPSRLVKEDGPYEPSPSTTDEDEDLKNLLPESDVLVTTYEKLLDKSGQYYSEEYGDLTVQKYFVGNKEVILGDITQAEDKKLFDSMSDGFLKKANSMKYGVKSFYSAQEKLEGQPGVNKKGSQASTFDEYKQDRIEENAVNPIAVAKFKRDGYQWSADMDNAALRRYFVQTGLEKEFRRREIALNELDGHELIVHFSNAFTSHGNTTDPNYRGRGYNLGVSYDLHLSRTSANLKEWSLQFLYERGVTEYDTGVYNARSEEASYGAFLNYYFVNNPLTINSFIYLCGIGIKNGSASVFSPDFTKEYSYQVLTLPALQLMTKYRFRTGDLSDDTVNIGASLNFGINLDIKKLSVIDRVDDNINSNISVSDLKYTVGMSVFF